MAPLQREKRLKKRKWNVTEQRTQRTKNTKGILHKLTQVKMKERDQPASWIGEEKEEEKKEERKELKMVSLTPDPPPPTSPLLHHLPFPS